MWLLIVITLCIVATGCVSVVDEQHFFHSNSRDKQQRPVNFYRVEVEGVTLLSSARYLAGYFDESAVDTYFSEFAQPKGGKFPGPTSQEKVQPLDPALAGRQLIMLLSSNSDEVATQIGALAQSERTTAAIGRLINRDLFSAADTAQLNSEQLKSRAKSLMTLAESTLLNITDPKALEQSDALNRVIVFVNELVKGMGYSVTFADLSSAKTWLAAHANELP